MNNIAQREVALAVSELPDLPEFCRETLGHGIKSGELLESALKRAAARVGVLSERILACARWYDTLKASRASGAL